jgi:hypothetical protein
MTDNTEIDTGQSISNRLSVGKISAFCGHRSPRKYPFGRGIDAPPPGGDPSPAAPLRGSKLCPLVVRTCSSLLFLCWILANSVIGSATYCNWCSNGATKMLACYQAKTGFASACICIQTPRFGKKVD